MLSGVRLFPQQAQTPNNETHVDATTIPPILFKQRIRVNMKWLKLALVGALLLGNFVIDLYLHACQDNTLNPYSSFRTTKCWCIDLD